MDVFSSVYRSFGAQQKSALYAAVKRGIELYGDKMKMELLLEVLEELEGYGNQVLTSISSRLVQLVDIDPFDYEAENQWDEYFTPGGNITIIQLAGYDQDEIKRLMAEFILGIFGITHDGTKDKAIPVILGRSTEPRFLRRLTFREKCCGKAGENSAGQPGLQPKPLITSLKMNYQSSIMLERKYISTQQKVNCA